MARLNHTMGSSARYRRPVAFRGIDGHQLAQQYALSRELENSRHSGEWHYPSEWQGGKDISALGVGIDDPYSGMPRSNEGGLLRRIAVWLSKVDVV